MATDEIIMKSARAILQLCVNWWALQCGLPVLPSDLCHLWILCLIPDVVLRSRYSPKALRPLNAHQAYFSILSISFLMVWCHFSVLVVEDLPHLRSQSEWLHLCPWKAESFPRTSSLEAPWTQQEERTLLRGELNWMWYTFPCFINHLEYYSKLWGQKGLKRKVSKEASKQQEQLLCNRRKNSKMDWLCLNIHPSEATAG